MSPGARLWAFVGWLLIFAAVMMLWQAWCA